MTNVDPQKSVKDQIAAYLKDAVLAVQVENIETAEAIGSQEVTNAVCCALEAVFLHGLKGSSANKNFWSFVKKFTHKSTLLQIMELSQISSDIGRCRAWIRVAFNDGTIDSYCKAIMDDNSTVRRYYDSSSFFRDTERCNALQTHLQGLSNFVFNLAFNSTVLNQWTTTTLVLAGLTTSGHLDWPVAFASSEAVTGRSALDASFQQRPFHSPVPGVSSRLSKSFSCPQDLSDAYDSCLQLTQSEIDAIRSMSSTFRESSETPVSMLSRPDFTENRPSIYNRLTYGISSDSDEHESSDLEQTDEQRNLQIERILQMNRDRLLLDFGRNEISSSDSAGKMLDSSHKTGDAALNNQPNDDNDTLNSVSIEDGKWQLSSCNVIEEMKPEIKSYNPFDEDVNVISENELSREQVNSNEKLSTDNSKYANFSSANDEMSQIEAGVKTDLIRKTCIEEKNNLWSAGDSGSNRRAEDDISAAKDASRMNKILTSETTDRVADLSGSESLYDDIYIPQRNEESFHSLLRAYTPSVSQTKMRTLDAIIDELPSVEGSGETIEDDCSSSDWTSIDASETYENHLDERVSQQDRFLYQISIENGLNEQYYQCRNCARAIGMFYGQDRVCAYDGFHYCYECHENKEHWIPAKVIFNWDFRPSKVSNLSYSYLQRITEIPCLNIEKHNLKLYTHVKPLETILDLRTQLHYIKSYIMTCTSDVALAFLEKFDDQPYLFENIHLYSLKDLSLVPSGFLQKRLQKIVKFATRHVYNCHRCGMKGFYCELCRATKVIYPFELSSTYRCPQCKTVFHRQCKTHLVPCPKCRRISERENSQKKSLDDPIDATEFSF